MDCRNAFASQAWPRFYASRGPKSESAPAGKNRSVLHFAVSKALLILSASIKLRVFQPVTALSNNWPAESAVIKQADVIMRNIRNRIAIDFFAGFQLLQHFPGYRRAGHPEFAGVRQYTFPAFSRLPRSNCTSEPRLSPCQISLKSPGLIGRHASSASPARKSTPIKPASGSLFVSRCVSDSSAGFYRWSIRIAGRIRGRPHSCSRLTNSVMKTGIYCGTSVIQASASSTGFSLFPAFELGPYGHRLPAAMCAPRPSH